VATSQPPSIELQQALVDLIRGIDPKATRYSDEVLQKV